MHYRNIGSQQLRNGTMAETNFVRDRILVPLVVCTCCAGAFVLYTNFKQQKKNAPPPPAPEIQITRADTNPANANDFQSSTREDFPNTQRWIEYIHGLFRYDGVKLRQYLNSDDVTFMKAQLADDEQVDQWFFYCRVLAMLGQSNESSDILLAFVRQTENWESMELATKQSLATTKFHAIALLGLTDGPKAVAFLKELSTVDGTNALMAEWEGHRFQEIFRGKGGELEYRILLAAYIGVAVMDNDEKSIWLNDRHETITKNLKAINGRINAGDDVPSLEEVEYALKQYRPLLQGLTTDDLIQDIGRQKYLELGWASIRLRQELREFRRARFRSAPPEVHILETWVRATYAGLTVEEYNAQNEGRQDRPKPAWSELTKVIDENQVKKAQ